MQSISLRIFSTVVLSLSFSPLSQAADEAPPKDEKAPTTKNLLKPTNELESWVFELNERGNGEMNLDGDAIVFETTETTGTDWHVQAYQTELDLEDGKEYIVRFKLRSPQEVTLLLVGQVHEPDWHEIGLHEEIHSTKELEDYEFEFTAYNTADKNNRIGFVLGIDKGEVFLQDMTLTPKESE
jgi:hypothetical protein